MISSNIQICRSSLLETFRGLVTSVPHIWFMGLIWFPAIQMEQVLNCTGRSSVQIECMPNSDRNNSKWSNSRYARSLPISQTSNGRTVITNKGKARANWRFQARIGVPTNSDCYSRSSQPSHNFPPLQPAAIHTALAFPINQSLQVAVPSSDFWLHWWSFGICFVFLCQKSFRHPVEEEISIWRASTSTLEKGRRRNFK
jgi:hypothetical protein